MIKEQMLSLIENVFFIEKRFSYNEIADTLDEYPDDVYEGNGVARYFEGKTNQDINLIKLLDDYPFDYKACIGFMKPVVASYFIGSFMHISILNIDLGQDLRSSLMSKLEATIYCGHKQVEEWFDDFRKYLSSDQKLVIVQYITYIEKNYGHEILAIDFEKAKMNFQ